MKEKLTVLIGEKEIQSRVEKLAAEISESYKGESLLVVGILSRSYNVYGRPS